MDISNGVLGAIVVVLAIYAGYMLVTKKSAWGLSKIGTFVPDDWEVYRKWTLVSLFIIGSVVLVYWSSKTHMSLAEVGEWSQTHWIPLFIIWALIATLVALNAKKLGAAVATLQMTLGGAMFVLFIGIPVWLWIPSTTSSECVKGHPCVPSLYSDGSSSAVDVPEGKAACFDPWMWQRLDEVGLMISYQTAGVPKTPFPCSAKDVYGGNCNAIYDKFSFKPKEKTPLPNHWFVASGSLQC